MSFKAYLQTQDDNITDEEAIKKYNEYKLEFKRQQLNEFFVTHKEEEWWVLWHSYNAETHFQNGNLQIWKIEKGRLSVENMTSGG